VLKDYLFDDQEREMTNLDSTTADAPQTGGRRRRSRQFLKASLAAVVAMLGVGFFATPAFAHDLTVTGVASCPANTYTITWTITNDYPEIETATVNSVTGGLGSLTATSVTIGNGSVSNLTSATITQTLPATTTGPIAISVTGTWPLPSYDKVTVTNSVTLPTGCFPPGLSVIKSIKSPASPVSLAAGSATPVVYELAIENTGVLATPSGITVTDAAPVHTTYVAGSAACLSGSSPACTANESAGVVTFTLAAGFASGATYLVSFAVTVDATAPAGTITNTATYTGPGCHPSDDSSTCSTLPVTFTVFVNPVVTVSKTANTSAVTAGQAAPVTYTLTATNTSSVPTNKATVITDTVPSGLTYVSGSAKCGSTPSCTATFDASTQTVTFTLGSGIPAGASESVTFQGTVNSTDTTSISNTASYTGNCTPAAPATTCQAGPVIITVANFTVSKSDSAGSNSVNPGDVVTYTLAAKNTGTGPGSITVTDAAPTGTTLTTPAPACPANTASTCSVTVTGSSISWVITSLAAGATDNLTFAVEVNPGTGGTHILNTGLFTEPGCTTVGGCSTNTTDNPVPPPTQPGTPTTTTTTVPPSVKTAARGAIQGATTVHTGEPWAGSTPYVVTVGAFGLSLLGFGVVRRRRAARTPTA